jgi:polysaccharide pyruvyl transferase WcaK-like protein
VDEIVCRSEESRKRLIEIGISRGKLHVAPDTGFLMKPVYSNKTNEITSREKGLTLVAVGVSHQVCRRFSDPATYDNVIAALIRHITTSLQSRVLIVPNELHHRKDRDDQAIADRIAGLVGGANTSVIDARQLTGPELKAVVAQCDVVVSSRYHTLVASLSIGVPCMAVGWHHKYEELFKLFGLEEWVFDHRECRVEQLLLKFNDLWDRRDALRRRIEGCLPDVEAQIREAAAVVSRRLADLAPKRVRLRNAAQAVTGSLATPAANSGNSLGPDHALGQL